MASLIRRQVAPCTLLLVAAVAAAGCGGPFEPEETIREAKLARRAGDLDAAIAAAEEGRRRSRGDPLLQARFELLRAELLLAGDSEDIVEAERILAATYETAAADPEIRARWHLVRGYARVKQSRFEEALPPLREASRIAAFESLPDVSIDARFHLGRALHDLGKFREAESAYEEALALARKSGDRFRMAAAQLNLSVPCLSQRRFDEAIGHLEEASALTGEEGADLFRSGILANLAACWREVGDLDRSLEAALEAVEIGRRAGAMHYLCRDLGRLGQIQESRGEVEDAVVSLREAVAIAEDLHTSGDVALWSLELATAQVLAGEHGEARERIAAARAAYRNLGRDDVQPEVDVVTGLAEADLTEAALARALGNDDRVVELCERVIASLPDEPSLAWRARAELARAFLRAGHAEDALESFAAAVAAIRDDRARLFRLESRASFLTLPIAVYQDYVALLLDLGLEDEALRAIESSRAQTMLDGMEEIPSNLLDVDRVLQLAGQHDVTLLSYWISPRGSFAWVFSAAGSRRVPLAGTDALADLVARHRATIEEGWRDPLEAARPEGRRLHRLLVQPVLELVPPGSRVIVVPDRPLHRLNLETVIAEEPTPHYLIEDWTVAVAPALSVLLSDPPARPSTDRSILLVGDPLETDPEFPRLPHAARELDTIHDRLEDFRRVQVREADATVEAVLSKIGEPFRWVHFAAHAQPGGGNPLDSAVILSAGPGGSKLYARDLVGRRIDADLVTLSACRSAGSRSFSGEGLVGLSWGLMRAGSPRVIAGLWDVSDRSTVTLMDDLYSGLSRGDRAADALRTAKLRLVHSHSNLSKPFYWGPFQLYTSTARP